MKTHFVGVTPDQYAWAVRIFGPPDVTHKLATWSAMGEIPGEDKVIFGKLAFLRPDKWRRKTGNFAHAVPPS